VNEAQRSQERLIRAAAERERIKLAYSDEYNDGARCAFLKTYPGKREPGGYPRGFHAWPLDTRNAWFVGFNEGFQLRSRGATGPGDG
jgi:hypothetical protein